MSQHSWDKNCVYRIREPDWHLAPRCSVLSPQLQCPNWETPPACLVLVCPQHPLSRDRVPEKPTDKKQQIPEHSSAISDAGYRAGRAGSSAPPFPVRGFCCILALPAKNVNVSWGILPTAPSRPSLQHQGNLHRSKANAGSPQLQVTSLKCC